MARLSLARKQKMSSNSNVDQRGRGKNKHYWTLEQDNALIVCLLELSRNLTRRADCGFKNSYLQQMESMLEAKLLDSNLKASPHIESRIKTLKGKYYCLAELLLLIHSTLVCEKSVFDEYVKETFYSKEQARYKTKAGGNNQPPHKEKGSYQLFTTLHI
ncbi:hypothetical protein F8388_026395 [Cannabis sativa]|uniref:Myb/SANT-like domain-containing protein n=1 Tax=Cannabis sativa TaxID=3483 RepID=A0A7J6ETK7_CANSA|nr:hypothetical protein F8388_026395 [Cannabis sativa]